MRVLLTLLLIVCGSVAEAGDPPRWTDLVDLLKEAKDSKKVSAFVGEHSLSEASKGPSGSFSAYDRSYSLMFREDRICIVVLRISEWPENYGEKHWKPYSEKLPGNLSAKDVRADVIRKLGNPVKNRENTWLHDGMYIWVHFDQKRQVLEELFVSDQIIEARKSPD
jgi:hypothetical protein